MHINISFYLPQLAVLSITILIVSVLWSAIGIALVTPLLSHFSRRSGEPLLESKNWFWVNLLAIGPFGWAITLFNLGSVSRGRARGKQRRKQIAAEGPPVWNDETGQSPAA